MSSKPRPYYKKDRPLCPFYGFNGLSGVFFESKEENQCGLKTLTSTPCQMELEGDTPDWNTCPHNTDENLEGLRRILDSWVYPHEFQPPSGKGIRGLTLRRWFEYLEVPIRD